MPSRHQRPTSARPSSERATSSMGAMAPSMASIDAKMKLLAQRMKIIENNMQVMGRTIVSYKNKLQEIERAVATAEKGSVDVPKLKAELKAEFMASGGAGIAPPLESSVMTKWGNSQLTDLKKSVELLHQKISELEYVIDSINPLEYVTLDQLNDVVDRKLSKIKK